MAARLVFGRDYTPGEARHARDLLTYWRDEGAERYSIQPEHDAGEAPWGKAAVVILRPLAPGDPQHPHANPHSNNEKVTSE
jgi:hypothetical protein